MTAPPGSWLKTSGMAMNPRSKLPPLAMAVAPATPKKATMAGMASEPPSTTSAVSLVAAVAMPDRARSSVFFR